MQTLVRSFREGKRTRLQGLKDRNTLVKILNKPAIPLSEKIAVDKVLLEHGRDKQKVVDIVKGRSKRYVSTYFDRYKKRLNVWKQAGKEFTEEEEKIYQVVNYVPFNWQQEESIRFDRMIQKHGLDFPKYFEEFPNRTEEAIKGRVYRLTRDFRLRK